MNEDIVSKIGSFGWSVKYKDNMCKLSILAPKEYSFNNFSFEIPNLDFENMIRYIYARYINYDIKEYAKLCYEDMIVSSPGDNNVTIEDDDYFYNELIKQHKWCKENILKLYNHLKDLFLNEIYHVTQIGYDIDTTYMTNESLNIVLKEVEEVLKKHNCQLLGCSTEDITKAYVKQYDFE